MYRNFNNLQLLREVTKTSLLHQLPATAIIIQGKEEGTLGLRLYKELCTEIKHGTPLKTRQVERSATLALSSRRGEGKGRSQAQGAMAGRW